MDASVFETVKIILIKMCSPIYCKLKVESVKFQTMSVPHLMTRLIK